MGEVAIWIRFGGKFDGSSKYVGGDSELLLVNNNDDYEGFKNMVAELLNVDDSESKMHFKFETGNPVKPLYGVTDERTFRLFMYHARQDSLKHSLMVTVDKGDFRSAQGNNNPSEKKKESPNLAEGDIARLESTPKGTNLGNINQDMETNVLPNVFANQDVCEREFDIPTPQGSSCVAATPPQGSPNVAASDNMSQFCPPVELCTNVPPIPHSVPQGDDNDAGSGNEKSISERIYGFGNISEEIEEDKIFKSKKDLNTTLSIISMREKFQFKVFKSNTRFLVVRCVHTNCSWRVRAKNLADSDHWMVTKYVNKHTCPTDFKTVRHRQATSWVIGECMKKRLINPGRVFRPGDVIDDMKRKFGVDVSYSVAWRGREYAYENLRLGTPAQSSNNDQTLVGRRKKRRISSVGKEVSRPKCSRCKESGHNRATCQNLIALHPSGETHTT